jgi:hypothetical protein
MGEERPNPLSDVAKGLGLLFRAARTAARKWPAKELEEVVVTSAREVGRAFENVATTIEREVLGKAGSRRARGAEDAPPKADDDKPKPPDAG